MPTATPPPARRTTAPTAAATGAATASATAATARTTTRAGSTATTTATTTATATATATAGTANPGTAPAGTPTASASPAATPSASPTTPAPAPAPDAPTATDSVGALLTRLQALYRQAEEAAEAYNAAEAALKARQDDERRLGTELGRARAALDAERAAAGRIAREQYQGARGLSPYARVLLTGDLRAAQDQRRLAAREGARQAGVLARLARGEQHAGTLATAARKALDAQQAAAARKKELKEEADRRLRDVERMLAALTPDQLTQVDAREARDTASAQRELLASGALGAPASAAARTPTAAGGSALAYAAAQVGKPYEWGAEGPEAYDCSGLTSQAWAHAGRAIPRTSQEQWARLPRVPLDRLRPGDLVVYFPTATHVALYIGDGKVIQAPRPGAAVKVSPLAANPLLGAVRPDAGDAPLASFTPPQLPEAASAGDDTGYSAAGPPAGADAAPEPGTDREPGTAAAPEAPTEPEPAAAPASAAASAPATSAR
ncbi:C40 family peptidase [Streptomyces sp. KD18]|nr:C40 family peptidase [Streptomyces sp. KD18]